MMMIMMIKIIIIIIIIGCFFNYSCFVYPHNNVLDKADRTVVIILLISTLKMEAAYPSETSATSPPDAGHVQNQDHLPTYVPTT